MTPNPLVESLQIICERVVLPVDTKQSYNITFECVINIFIISAVYLLSCVCDLSLNNPSLPLLQLVQFGEV